MNTYCNRKTTSVSYNIFLIASIVFLAITIAISIVPFYPEMPRGGLDPSWIFAGAYAFVNEMAFGKDIIFTLGPLSQIFTHVFHPASDNIIFLLSIYFSFAFFVSLACILWKQSPWWWLAFGFFFACVPMDKNAIFFMYPFLVGLSFVQEDFLTIIEKRTWIFASLVILLSSCFGLLALVKGSFLPLCVFVTVLIAIKFYQEKYYSALLLWLVSPILAALLFWLVAKQDITDILLYFYGLAPIMSGYTEAMSLSGPAYEHIVYIVASVSILAFILFAKTSTKNRIFICLMTLAYLFLSFKQGFVRHDTHAIAAMTAVLFAGMIAGVLFKAKYYFIVLFVAVLSGGIIVHNYVDLSIQSMTSFGRHRAAFHGLSIRFNKYDIFIKQYRDAIGSIKKEGRLPWLQGSCDIYPYDQAYLIASGNAWNPRPAFQSYTVYTPQLARKNAQHLSSASAPDTLFFAVKTIDYRMPSMDDGASWPEILHRYAPVGFDGNFLQLRKNSNSETPVVNALTSNSAVFGEMVDVPGNAYPVFAEIKIQQTFTGKIFSLAFKPSELEIELHTVYGDKVTYRIVSNMIESGFIISPVVDSTFRFALLYAKNTVMEQMKVKSFVIKPKKMGWIWIQNYEVTFYSLEEYARYNMAKILNK